MKPVAAAKGLEESEEEEEEEEYSQEFEDLEAIVSPGRVKKEADAAGIQITVARPNETPEPDLMKLIKMGEQGSEQRPAFKDSSLDMTDPIAQMLKDEEESDQEGPEAKEEKKS